MSVKDLCGKFLRNCVEKNSTFLFVTAAAGWFLASAAQTIGLITNKKLTKEEKEFLVPQEIMDGTFNIASYAAITCTLMKGVEAITKKRLPDSPRAVEGAKTLAAIAGGIISSNIVTPILRNKSGVFIKEKMHKNGMEMPPQNIYDGKTQINFQSKRPLNINSYVNFAKNMSNRGSLKI